MESDDLMELAFSTSKAPGEIAPLVWTKEELARWWFVLGWRKAMAASKIMNGRDS